MFCSGCWISIAFLGGVAYTAYLWYKLLKDLKDFSEKDFDEKKPEGPKKEDKTKEDSEGADITQNQ